MSLRHAAEAEGRRGSGEQTEEAKDKVGAPPASHSNKKHKTTTTTKTNKKATIIP
jgi:hypothetical protein